MSNAKTSCFTASGAGYRQLGGGAPTGFELALAREMIRDQKRIARKNPLRTAENLGSRAKSSAKHRKKVAITLPRLKFMEE
jgi:hypothetical protein